MKKILLSGLIALGSFAGAQCTTPVSSFPYTQDFESSTPPGLPSCTLASNAGQSAGWSTWSADGNYGWSAGDKTITDYADAGKTDNAWFFTRSIALIGGQSYTISYKIGATNATNTRKLAIAYGPNQSSTGMVTVGTLNKIDGTYQKSVTFVASTTGTYYIGFNTSGNGDSSWSSIILDNITIDKATLAVGDTKNKDRISLFPNPVSDFLNLSTTSGIKSVTITDITGRQIGSYESSKEINLSKIKAGNYIVTLHMEDGSTQNSKIIKK